MTLNSSHNVAIEIGRRMAGDLAEYGSPQRATDASFEHDSTTSPLGPEAGLLAAFDSRVADLDLRAATRSRFISTHYADAVEAGVKVLNECIRKRANLTSDGDPLITTAFSPSNPILRINPGRSQSDLSAQRGHMQLCQGVVAAWRNPRAHALLDDLPSRALMMLEQIDDLLRITKSATRTRQRRKP